MTKTQINKYREILETKQAELLQLLRFRDSIAIEKSPDSMDQITHSATRQMAEADITRASKCLRLLRAALARIEDGSFGICQHCEGDIDLKRLNAVAWAAYCITCQTEHGSDPDDVVVLPAPPPLIPREVSNLVPICRLDGNRDSTKPSIFDHIIMVRNHVGGYPVAAENRRYGEGKEITVPAPAETEPWKNKSKRKKARS